MKTPGTQKNQTSGDFVSTRNSSGRPTIVWVAYLNVLGASLLLCSCGRVNEIAELQIAADRQLTDVKMQFSELNKVIAQEESNNAKLRVGVLEGNNISPVDLEKSIQSFELRIQNLKTEKDKALKRLEEARRLLVAQQARGKL